MNPLQMQVMHEVAIETQEGKMTFPEVVRRLSEIGIESYFVDLAVGRKTYYLADGGTHTESMILNLDPVAAEFSASKLAQAIRGAQAGSIQYPEFVKRSTAAGVQGYWAFLAGRNVVYFGRMGQFHVEEFPPAKSQL